MLSQTFTNCWTSSGWWSRLQTLGTINCVASHRKITSLLLTCHQRSQSTYILMKGLKEHLARSSWRRQDSKWGQVWIWLTLLLVVSCDSDAGYSGFCTHPLITSNYGIHTNVIKHSLPSPLRCVSLFTAEKKYFLCCKKYFPVSYFRKFMFY